MSETLVYYPQPPIPLDKGFTSVVINELCFIDPFSPLSFDPITEDERAEFDAIISNITEDQKIDIPTCQRPHSPPDLDYREIQHLDGYPVEIETLEGNGAGFHYNPILGRVGNIHAEDEFLHELLDKNPTPAKELAQRTANDLAEADARNRAEEAFRKADHALKTAEEARKTAHQTMEKVHETNLKTKNKVSPGIQNLLNRMNITNPGGSPTSLSHMRRIIDTNRNANEAVIYKPGS